MCVEYLSLNGESTPSVGWPTMLGARRDHPPRTVDDLDDCSSSHCCSSGHLQKARQLSGLSTSRRGGVVSLWLDLPRSTRISSNLRW
jgi:hypothetical protein